MLYKQKKAAFIGECRFYYNTDYQLLHDEYYEKY